MEVFSIKGATKGLKSSYSDFKVSAAELGISPKLKGSLYIGDLGGGKSNTLGGTKTITNDILESPRTGSALKVDDIKPIYKTDPVTGKSYMAQEFPAGTQAHGFNNIVDNYAGYATKTPLSNATLYQLDGSLNGTLGRFEWIIQDGSVTHRMFIQGGTMNGVSIVK